MRQTAFLLAALAATGAAAQDIDFAAKIRPILDERCIQCHGETTKLAELQLHSGDALATVVENGLLIPGDSESSELYNRLILPDDHPLRMPKGGDPLTPDQIELIENWINQGAEFTSAEATGESMEEHATGEGQSSEGPPMPDVPPAPEAAIQALADAGASVVPIYSGSPMLSVSFPSRPGAVTDETVDLVLAVAPNVGWLNLGRTSVTDQGATKLAECENLMRLHLERTKVTDATVEALSGLNLLSYLNLYGTAVTDAALKHAEAMPNLSRLYLWQTEVSYDAAKELMAARPELEVNLGWDHPGVVRERLTKELQRVTERKKEAEQRAQQAEAQLTEAKNQLEASVSREQELKAELESLDQDSSGDDAQE